MKSRRSFFKKTLALAGTFTFSFPIKNAKADSIADALISLNTLTPEEAVMQEEIWDRIAEAYSVSPTILNLNNAGVSPQPKVVQEALDRYNKMSNELPTYYMSQVLDRGREELRRQLASLAGAGADEIAIVRNATEALGIVTHGLALEKGDEIVMCRQDYPHMIHSWNMRMLRDGIKINWINLDLPIENEQTVIDHFVKASTEKTKVWHITHMINWNGQILPVKKLCEEARRRKIMTIVDGAQSFAQLDFKLSDFDADFFGASLHKWLCAPFGTGILYVKKANIKSLWPLFPNDKPESDDIRKFEAFGTRSIPQEQAIGQALSFHNAIGGKRKEERLRYLKNYWCEKVAGNPKVKLHTSVKPEFSCAIGHFSIEGLEPGKVVSRLMADYQIHSVPSKIENLVGVRITPHVYTSVKDLDRFSNAVMEIAAG